jgi:hypothetical protein
VYVWYRAAHMSRAPRHTHFTHTPAFYWAGKSKCVAILYYFISYLLCYIALYYIILYWGSPKPTVVKTVAGTEVHHDHQQLMPFCSFLGLFAVICTCSCTRCANQKHSSHADPCSTFTLGTVQQHDPHATERITTLR